MDERREFCLMIENNKIVGLSEVLRTAIADAERISASVACDARK